MTPPFIYSFKVGSCILYYGVKDGEYLLKGLGYRGLLDALRSYYCRGHSSVKELECGKTYEVPLEFLK